MAVDTMKVSNLSHAMHVLHGRCVPTTEFYYDGRWWPVAHATRARPFVELDVAVALVRGSAEGPAKEGKRRILYRRGVTLKETRDDIAHWLGAALAWLEDHPTASDLTSRDERWTAAIEGYVRVCDALDRARTVL